MDFHAADRPAIDIVIPLYRNSHLVAPLRDSLLRCRQELVDLRCSIVLINDSPDDKDLAAALESAHELFGPDVPCNVVVNDQNLGFVRSVNLAANAAVERGHDLILLNSDTIVFPGAIRELAAIAYSDPMIGFVSPRSNNATICSFPPKDELKKTEPDEAYRIFADLSRYLPVRSFVPTAVGFCLFIKCDMIREFGCFDEVYAQGYNEENDLIMRANRCGFRAALANHAFVYHLGEVSFAKTGSPKHEREKKNQAILHERYPEYPTSVHKYFTGPHYQAERLISALLPDRYGRVDLVFDCSSFGPYHNGTFESARQILSRAPQMWRGFNVHVMASDEAVRFHELDDLDGVTTVGLNTSREFAVALRFAQPFTPQQVRRMSELAPVNVYAMLDPIAYDCLHLNHSSNLDSLWGAVFQHADGVIYISDFVRDLFHERFTMHPALRELVAYLSLDFRDYVSEEANKPAADHGHLLVIGNGFHHKRLPDTVDVLSQSFPQERIVAIGMPEDSRRNVISYPSGNLSDRRMERLLRDAYAVVFPSVYEGFGIPIIRSLANRKPVLARRTPVAEAMREKTGEFENLILYSCPADLVQRLKASLPTWQDGSRPHVGDATGGWDDVTADIGEFLTGMPRAVTFQRLTNRLEHARLLEWGLAYVGSAPAQERIHHLQAVINNRDRHIEDIHRSWSWRITAPLRVAAGEVLRILGK